MRRLKGLWLCLCLGLLPRAHGQGFDKWVDDQILDILNKQQVGQNGKGSDRQRQSPSGDTRSTSLVDQSSATDFISIAANLIPVPSSTAGGGGTGSVGSAVGSSGASGSSTVTTTLYAILAGLNKKSPTDPTFYAAHVDARRWSVTAGTAASTIATDNTDKPATVLGTKFLFLNGRELYTKKNLTKIEEVQKRLSKATAEGAGLKARIRDLVFIDQDPLALDSTGHLNMAELASFLLTGAMSDASFPATKAKLKPATLKQITDMLTSSVDAFVALDQTLKDTYDAIQKGAQVSFAYTANLRRDQGNNYHRAEFIVDYGLSTRINWTLNASGDYTDHKMAKDLRGGRVATEFQGDVTKANAAWGRLPMRLSFSGEGKWLTSRKPQYTVQSQLSIPISQGIDLPLVYRYENRAAQLAQKHNSEVRLGFSVDLSRLAQVFK